VVRQRHVPVRTEEGLLVIALSRVRETFDYRYSSNPLELKGHVVQRDMMAGGCQGKYLHGSYDTAFLQ
jgi:hypothetical protein